MAPGGQGTPAGVTSERRESAAEHGMALLQTAIATIQAVRRFDDEGLRVLVNHCDEPRQLAGMLAAVAVGLLELGGAGSAADALLSEVQRRLTDPVLDFRDELRRNAADGR